MKMELSNILYTCTEDNWIPRWLSGKESACNTGDPGDLSSIPCQEDTLRGKWHPTPVFFLEKFHEQRSLEGYSPWGSKESDMTERLHFTSGGRQRRER